MASLGETFLPTFTLCLGLSCFRCQPLSYHSIFVNYQPLSYDFGCQPLLCTCVLCTVYCCTVLCTGVQYILCLSCLAVNLSFMILVVNLYYILVYWCTVLFIGVLIMLGLSCLTVNLDLFTGELYMLGLSYFMHV